MIQYIQQAALLCGIESVVTNSEEKIETQLNSLTSREESPIMLVSWDIDTDLNFDENGFLENPSSNIVALLMKKAPSLTKVDMEATSTAMGALYQQFIRELWAILLPLQRSLTQPISQATYKLVPKHGAGKHSGVLCKWTMRSNLDVC